MTTQQGTRVPPVDALDEPGWPRLVWDAVGPTEEACCCPAKPAYQAVLPPADGRAEPVELLLCAHHYRVSRLELGRIGGAIYDSSGRAVALPAGVTPIGAG
jgi:hypothetical protein